MGEQPGSGVSHALSSPLLVETCTCGCSCSFRYSCLTKRPNDHGDQEDWSLGPAHPGRPQLLRAAGPIAASWAAIVVYSNMIAARISPYLAMKLYKRFLNAASFRPGSEKKKMSRKIFFLIDFVHEIA